MNVLILGGNSVRHKEWVRQLAQAIQSRFEHIDYVDYRHWESGGDADVEYEINQAVQKATILSNEYIIIAKSIGTVITVLGIARQRLKPVRCLFLGVPLQTTLAFPDVPAAYASLPPTTIMQHQADPLGSAAALQQFVSSYGNGQTNVITTPGNTHDYSDFRHIAELAAATD